MNFTWRPGIGDPSVGGWLTVVLYLAAAWMAYRVAGRLRAGCAGPQTPEPRLWLILAVGFLLLGINKQLDLQSALTDMGRVAASWGGWYEQRRFVQFVFLIGVSVAALAVLMVLLYWARTSPPSTFVALCGTVFVGAYVVIRAASFHHVDELIGSSVLGLRWNWVFEMGGIAIVLLGASLRERAAGPR